MNALSTANRHANIPIFVPHVGCPHRCSFCDQRAISGAGKPVTPQTVKDLCTRALQTLPTETTDVEIAFFGGSFTAIPMEEMTALLQAAAPFLKDRRIAGIRISTRPDAVGDLVLERLRHYGVTAIELGAQSMDDAVLQRNRRGHSADDVRKASRRIRQFGFSLGLQMMTGLFGSSPALDWETGRQLAALSPDTMRIYPTITLAGTELDRLRACGRYRPESREQTIETCSRLLRLFKEQGIVVIRLGLHSSEAMQDKITGGFYHPALRELCQSRLYFMEILTQLQVVVRDTPQLLRVQPQVASQVIGQKRSNLAELNRLGYRVRVQIVPALSMPFEILSDV